MFRLFSAAFVISSLLGCAGPQKPVIWREMLGRSIEAFADPLPDNNQQKVWIHDMDDKECDRGLQKGVEVIVGGLAPDSLKLNKYCDKILDGWPGPMVEGSHSGVP